MRRSSKKNHSNPYIIEGIKINTNLLKKYLNREGEKKLKVINDLAQLTTKTDNELLKVLEQMMKSKNYFKYCSSLLININPGPNFIYNYLNLKKWINYAPNLNSGFTEKKPHLYSFMQYVYETMVKENKDQVVNLLGPIGSGKTFNLVHIIEYFTTMYGPKSHQQEIFEMFHKSIQLIHIFGSIYRENNIESTCCGLLIKIGFNQNNVISSFGVQSQILDFTLPFSENGRSFSIFHAFIKGANDELKHSCKLPESDEYLSFFSKFLTKFSEKVRERLTFNDLEIWNRFHSLSKFFTFTTDEVIDIMQCLALILNLNELTISKVQVRKKKNKHKDENEEKNARNEIKEFFEIQKGKTCKKICKNLNIELDQFLNCLYKFKSLQEAKTFIISFMKQTYYIIFDFVLIKIRDHVNLYFSHLNKKIGTNNFKKTNYIYFIDFPGDIEDKTLGGYTTNIANECLNMYAATGFYEIAEKLIRENIILKKFFPLKSYFAVSTCMDKGGLLEHLSKPLNKENFNSLINNCSSKHNFMNCIKFKEKQSFEENDLNFTYIFSHKKMEFNYEILFSETKSLLKNDTITKIFSLTQNYVIKSTYENILVNKSKDFYSFFTGGLCKIFEPIKDIKPFIVFCFHSNNSYKIFFKDRDKDEKEVLQKKNETKLSISNLNKNKSKTSIINLNKSLEEIPKNLTLDMIKNSFIFPVLFWNWYGFKEWIHIDELIREYSVDFEKVKNRIIKINNLDPERKKFEPNIILNFNDLPKEEIAKCTLSVLSKEGDFIIGKEYILMKQGTLQRMRLYLNSMIDTAENMSIHLNEKINSFKKEKYLEKNNDRKRRNTVFIPESMGEKMKLKLGEIKKEKKRKFSKFNIKFNYDITLDYDEVPLPKKKIFRPLEEDSSRRYLLKQQCLLNIISNGRIINDQEKQKIMKGKIFNLYHLISHRDKVQSGLEEDLKDDLNLEELQIDSNDANEKELNINDFSMIKDRLSFDKSKNRKMNEYSKNVNSIIKIQSHIRRMFGKNKYIILKYIYSEIILIQKFIRGHITRIKFRKFLNCLEKIKKIQRLYHKRHIIKVRAATRIQEFWLRKLKLKKIKEQIIARKRAQAKGEYYNFEIDSFSNFTQNNYKLENHLRKFELQNDKTKLTKKLIKETDPKKIVQILLYGGEGEKKLTRAQKYGSDLKIEDKLLMQGEIMKKKKQELINENNKKYIENNNKFVPRIPKNVNEILGNKYPGEFLKRLEFYKLFKEKNLDELKQERIIPKKMEFEDTDNDSDKIKKNKYDFFVKNAFDRLHNEQLQIEKEKKRRNQYEINTKSHIENDSFKAENPNEKDINKNENKKSNKRNQHRMTLSDLLLSDQVKKIYRNSIVGIPNNNNNEIWPKEMKNNELSQFKENNEINKKNKLPESDSESSIEEENDSFF